MPWDAHNGIELTDISASVLIVSDSLFSGEIEYSKDESGPIAIEILSEFGFESINLDYYPDDQTALKGKIEGDIAQNVGLIILIGGTGVSKRDVTVEGIREVINKELPGFGEEFRRRSYLEIGGKGLLSRAIAGVTSESMIVGLPGSPNATRMGLELIQEIVGHILDLRRK